MPMLWMQGFDERYPLDQEHPSLNMPMTWFRSGSDAYLSQGFGLEIDRAVTEGTWCYLRKPLSGTHTRMIVGGMTRQMNAPRDTAHLGIILRRDGAVLDIRNDETGGTGDSRRWRIESSGMVGTDLDETNAIDAPLQTGWRASAIMVEDMDGGGIRITFGQDGVIHESIDFPDTEWPAGEWTDVDFGVTKRSALEERLDDFYCTTEAMLMFAKVSTIRPDTQGFHDDYSPSAGTKPAQTNNAPPSADTIAGAAGDVDTVNMDTFSAPDAALPNVVAVEYTVLADTTGPTVVPIVRKDGTDEDAGALDVSASRFVSVVAMDEQPAGGAWDADAINDSEFGTRIEA